jgi:hypothetical protein
VSDHYCRACRRDIKSLGWATHLSGKKHKENMKALHIREVEDDWKHQGKDAYFVGGPHDES